ncbi:S8 family peptidase [Actinacidiphila bryophytorum]|uniref:Peptidase inhibitor I9 n=1 Tax=Actinacidiphila bryophytorum TaxID=1436133 RepID=A0A9W4MER0_9ACTN|nr:S8 family peptidase [Actinacidiphila bryophytorum]MBM9435727.1 S8 family peptidase [Actinacidiphila bryophytorum]MBN6543905.1 S8 family peptidase [Actinacidiphila bryophytorum]CAG7650512.1 Peptidase inhibitor I9 [Actinacidiphila bryophytorum]
MRLFARGLTAAALVLAPLTAVGTPAVAAIPLPTPAATLAPLRTHADAVAGQYIVTVQKALDPSAMAQKTGVKPFFTYSSALRGFAVTLNSTQLDAVRRMPGVEAVEENATVSAFDLGTATGTTTRPAAGQRGIRAAASSWGLDRIDQRNLPLDGQFTTTGKGAGATAYIMDTGIDFGHSEFGGRAVPGFDAVGDGRNGQDCQGHGTHVAGTVGGATYGVAPQAKLVSVRVLGCDGTGSWAGIIAGFDWVAKNAQQPAVLNASLGGGFSPAVNDAATAVADAGVLPVVAAGNSSEDACNISPAGAAGAFTVGATDSADRQTGFSNFGDCLTLYAPGQNITSAKLGGGSVALSGTSMASPHAAGVALLYKAANPSADSQTVGNWVAGQATANVLSVSAGSPNRLLFTGGL